MFFSAELWLFVWWGNPMTLWPCEENMVEAVKQTQQLVQKSSNTLAAKNLGDL